MMDKKNITARCKLIKKVDKDKKYIPSPEELKAAYGYLDFCMYCGKRIRFGAYNHCFLGNYHKFGCSYRSRKLGNLYFLIMFILKIPITLPLVILGFIVSGIITLIKKISTPNATKKKE